MPVTYQTVAAALSDADTLTAFIREIDSRLGNPNWVKTWVRNEEVNPTWFVIMPGTATRADKEYIISTYKAAGWGTVKVLNSAENGEDPGLVGCTFMRDPE